MEFTTDEVATIAEVFNFYLTEIKKEQKKSKPGMPIYESMEALIRKAYPIYEKALLTEG
jgi:hypothetical protein